MAEADELPKVNDTMVKVNNPRRIDGKDLHYMSENVVVAYWPLERISFIEVVSGTEEEEIIGFVRE